MGRIVWVVCCLASLAACVGLPAAEQPARRFRVGEALFIADFEEPYGWDQYDSDGLSLLITDGVYRAELSRPNLYLWGLNRQMHSDVVIEAEAYVRSSYARGIYGLMCRAGAENDSRGYAFLVSVNGSFSIRRSNGTAFDPLVQWQSHSAIRRGPARNRLRAVCQQDYLAFYINGEFIADIFDERYSRGLGGVVVGVTDDGRVAVDFDNFSIWQAE